MIKKNYKKKNGLKKFNNTVRTVGNVARTAVTALGAAKLALSLINPEFKMIDVDATATPSTTASLVLLNGCVQGSDFDERIGRSIKMKSIQFDMIISKNASATVQQYVRVMLVLDKDPKATAPTFQEIVQLTTSPIVSPRNLTYRKRIVILKDFVVCLGINSSDAQKRSYYRKLDSHTIYNSSNVGTIADIAENSLYLVLVSDATTNLPSVTYYHRLRFLDN